MNLRKACGLLALLAATGSAGVANGQTPQNFGPALPPRFSPYLNLARPGVSPAINYYGLVRPQNQLTESVRSLQANQLNPFAAANQQGNADGAIVTGTPVGFQNHLSFFQNQFSAGGFNTLGGAGTPGPNRGGRLGGGIPGGAVAGGGQQPGTLPTAGGRRR